VRVVHPAAHALKGLEGSTGQQYHVLLATTAPTVPRHQINTRAQQAATATELILPVRPNAPFVQQAATVKLGPLSQPDLVKQDITVQQAQWSTRHFNVLQALSVTLQDSQHNPSARNVLLEAIANWALRLLSSVRQGLIKSVLVLRLLVQEIIPCANLVWLDTTAQQELPA